MFPGVFQSADLINKFHRTNRQQGPAAGRAGVDGGGEEKQHMKGREGVSDKKTIGIRSRQGPGQQEREETDRLEEISSTHGERERETLLFDFL